MLEFIAHNKEWLFSGVGVAVLSTLFFIAKWLYNWQKSPMNHKVKSLSVGTSVNTPSNIHDSPIPPVSKGDSLVPEPAPFRYGEYSQHPSPKDISNQIERLPPFQKIGAEKNYTGLKVKWKVSLAMIHPKDGDLIEIACNHREYFRYVKTVISLSRYPRFKIIREGEAFWIYGEILSIEPSGFKIRSHHIEFDDGLTQLGDSVDTEIVRLKNSGLKLIPSR